MKDNNKVDDLKFQKLMDALAESVLELSDEEVLEEMVLNGEDPEAVAAEVRQVLDEGLLKFKKQRLQEFKKQHAEQRAQLEKRVISIPDSPEERRSLLESVFNRMPEYKQPELTAQYRNLSGIDDQEIEELLRELGQLGVLDELE